MRADLGLWVVSLTTLAKNGWAEKSNAEVRLTRQTLACSKKLANHIGAIWFFVHRYHAALVV